MFKYLLNIASGLAFAAIFAFCSAASASVIYLYTGNALYDHGVYPVGQATAQFTVEQSLQGNFSGPVTITSGSINWDIQHIVITTPISAISVATDSAGNIKYWSIGAMVDKYTQNDPNSVFTDFTYASLYGSSLNGQNCGKVCDFFHLPPVCDLGTIQPGGNCGSGPIFLSANAPGTWTSNAPLSAAPEPATWAMMVVGVGGMGAALRARRRKIAAAAEHRTIHPMMM